jgi:dTDP-4-amino-4,6-dideoxygalactose transaminase
LAQLYREHLKSVKEVGLPAVHPDSIHSFHLFVIRARERDRLQEFLLSHGVQTLIHFPKALPNLPAYAHLKTPLYPVSDRLQEQVLSLPLYPELPSGAVEYVCGMIKAFYNS